MTDRTKTLEQEEVLYEFDAQRYSLFGKPLGTDRVLIVRTEDGRARFTTRELDGSLAIGQLQLGAAAAEEILRLKAAATASDKEIEALRAELADWHESAERAAGESCGDEQHCTCVGALRARIKELEGYLSKAQVALVYFTRVRGDRILDRDCNWLMLDRDMEDAIINAHNKEHND